MDDSLLLGLWRCTLPVPRAVWQRMVRGDANLAFMSAEHHAVRNYVVRELPRLGKPMPPALLSHELGLSPDRVGAILDDLERHMTFLFRNWDGDVVWAYPVTADATPHRVTFSTGERINAA